MSRKHLGERNWGWVGGWGGLVRAWSMLPRRIPRILPPGMIRNKVLRNWWIKDITNRVKWAASLRDIPRDLGVGYEPEDRVVARNVGFCPPSLWWRLRFQARQGGFCWVCTVFKIEVFNAPSIVIWAFQIIPLSNPPFQKATLNSK